VHRESIRLSSRIGELETQIQPSALSKALSEDDARCRDDEMDRRTELEREDAEMDDERLRSEIRDEKRADHLSRQIRNRSLGHG
jgi:hypothetical protein